MAILYIIQIFFQKYYFLIVKALRGMRGSDLELLYLMKRIWNKAFFAVT